MGRSVRDESTKHHGFAMRLVAPCFVAVTLLLVGVVPATGQALQTDDGSNDSGSYSVTASVNGDTVTIELAELSTPVGALELELRNVPALVSDECVLASGMGACAQTDNGVRIVALNPTGWQEPAVLLELRFTDAPTTAELVIGRGTDVTGVDLVGTASTTVDAGAGSGSSDQSIPGWLIAIVLAGLVGLLAGVVAKRRTVRPSSHPE